MKKNLVLLIMFGLMLSMTGMVVANTVDSSTMIFEGPLTNNSGVFTGIIPMINEHEEQLGDNIAGFDVYAKDGNTAMYDLAGSPTQDYTSGIIVDNDAYETVGGWGAWYSPDVADLEMYQLRLDSGNWYLEYHSSTDALASPMSGEIDWNSMYASEIYAGSYYSGMGTPESVNYALDNEYTGQNTGVSSWDMDWTWGSEYIPLEYPGFSVSVEDMGSDIYRVTLTPAPVSQVVIGDLDDIISISVNPSVSFGAITRGSEIIKSGTQITIDGSASDTENGVVYVYAEVTGEDKNFYDSLLEIEVENVFYNIIDPSFPVLEIPDDDSVPYNTQLHGNTLGFTSGKKQVTIVYTAYGEPLP